MKMEPEQKSRRKAEKEDEKEKLEEKKRKLFEKSGEIVKSKQAEKDSSISRVLRIEPYASFKKGAKKPSPIEIEAIDLKAPIEDMALNDALREAEKMKADGANLKSPVTLIRDGHREEHTTLRELLKPKTRTRLRKDFDKGGLILFGGGGGGGSSDGSGGFKAEHAASTLMKVGGMIAEEWSAKPRLNAGKRRAYAEAVAGVVDAVRTVVSPPHGSGTVTSLGGGAHEALGPAGAFRGPSWYRMDETSKLAAIWWYENMKFRGQYSYVGPLIGYPWGPMKDWKKVEKARRSKKKYSKLEKLLDIFYINIEDVFEIDHLTAQEIFDLEDFDKKHPTEKQYQAMKKLMKEEGYVEQRQFISAVEHAQKYEPSDSYIPR